MIVVWQPGFLFDRRVGGMGGLGQKWSQESGDNLGRKRGNGGKSTGRWPRESVEPRIILWMSWSSISIISFISFVSWTMRTGRRVTTAGGGRRWSSLFGFSFALFDFSTSIDLYFFFFTLEDEDEEDELDEDLLLLLFFLNHILFYLFKSGQSFFLHQNKCYQCPLRPHSLHSSLGCGPLGFLGWPATSTLTR